MLLSDLRELFAAERSGVLFTSEILAALHAREDRPWPEYRRGKPMTPVQLAALLKPLKILSGSVRRGELTNKGYAAKQFADAWARYLPACAPVTTSQPLEAAAFSTVTAATSGTRVTDHFSTKPAECLACDVVTAPTTVPAWEGESITSQTMRRQSDYQPGGWDDDAGGLGAFEEAEIE